MLRAQQPVDQHAHRDIPDLGAVVPGHGQLGGRCQVGDLEMTREAMPGISF